MNNTSSTLHLFSNNVITEPEGILVEARREVSKDIVVKLADGTQRMATKDVKKFDKEGYIKSITYTWL